MEDQECGNLPIALRRGKRKMREVNYKEVPKLPRAESIKVEKKLYPVIVAARKSDGDDAKVKIHYVGYSSDFDEWRDEQELESLEEEGYEEVQPTTASSYQPYTIHKALRVRVKQALTCGRKTSPNIKITISFDLIQFNGGLKTVGVPFKTVHGVQHFKINHYRDLNYLLGSNWHFRGLNTNGDYGYVELDTVDFCLRKGKCFVEYLPPQSDTEPPSKSETDTGYILSFCFVCNYGTNTTFGKNKKIFYE